MDDISVTAVRLLLVVEATKRLSSSPPTIDKSNRLCMNRPEQKSS